MSQDPTAADLATIEYGGCHADCKHFRAVLRTLIADAAQRRAARRRRVPSHAN